MKCFLGIKIIVKFFSSICGTGDLVSKITSHSAKAFIASASNSTECVTYVQRALRKQY